MNMLDKKLPLVLISGKKQSGKNTLAGFFVEKSFIEIAFADALKVQLCDFVFNTFGIDIPLNYFYDNEKKEELVDIFYSDKTQATIRTLMQKYGQMMKELFGEMYWVNKVVERLKDNYEDIDRGIVISDARFIYEIEGIKKELGSLFNIHTIRINRGDIENSDPDISETHLDDNGQFNFIIENNYGIKELKESFESIYNILI